MIKSFAIALITCVCSPQFEDCVWIGNLRRWRGNGNLPAHVPALVLIHAGTIRSLWRPIVVWNLALNLAEYLDWEPWFHFRTPLYPKNYVHWQTKYSAIISSKISDVHLNFYEVSTCKWFFQFVKHQQSMWSYWTSRCMVILGLDE